MTLSIVIPVFNEEKTIEELLKRVIAVELNGLKKEILVIDDGSSDRSPEIIKKLAKQSKNIIFLSKPNGGKGTAVNLGIQKASGDYILIQDADLEYDPKYIKTMWEPVADRKAEVVYGTRLDRLPNLRRDEKEILFLIHFFGTRFLSLITSILYGQWITDMETCYKLFPKKAVQNIKLMSKSFEFEPEITAKLIKKGYQIVEVPIRTTPRGYGDGKKLHTIKDGTKALLALVKYRFVN